LMLAASYKTRFAERELWNIPSARLDHSGLMLAARTALMMYPSLFQGG
jgi:hypothetical protein